MPGMETVTLGLLACLMHRFLIHSLLKASPVLGLLPWSLRGGCGNPVRLSELQAPLHFHVSTGRHQLFLCLMQRKITLNQIVPQSTPRLSTMIGQVVVIDT